MPSASTAKVGKEVAKLGENITRFRHRLASASVWKLRKDIKAS